MPQFGKLRAIGRPFEVRDLQVHRGEQLAGLVVERVRDSSRGVFERVIQAPERGLGLHAGGHVARDSLDAGGLASFTREPRAHLERDALAHLRDNLDGIPSIAIGEPPAPEEAGRPHVLGGDHVLNRASQEFRLRVAAEHPARAVQRGEAALVVEREDHVAGVLHQLAISGLAGLAGRIRLRNPALPHFEGHQPLDEQPAGQADQMPVIHGRPRGHQLGDGRPMDRGEIEQTKPLGQQIAAELIGRLQRFLVRSLEPLAEELSVGVSGREARRRAGPRRRGPDRCHPLHFLTVTVVPRPSSERISKSSISRRTPGRPRPRLPDVE